MNLDLDSTNHSGDLLIRIETASVGYGSKQIYNALNAELRYRDRVALMGTNGSGKSTLFKRVCDELKPVSGVIRLGENVSIGFMQQETASFDGASTPLSYIRLATDISDTEARDILHYFLKQGRLGIHPYFRVELR